MKIHFKGATVFERFLINKTLKRASSHLRQPKNLALSLSFVSAENIKELNKTYRGVEDATDVLAFPSLELEGGEIIENEKYKTDIDLFSGELFVGDVVICRQRATWQAREYGHGYKREAAYLALHGFLHLLGYDHGEPCQKEKMDEVQNAVLSSLKITRKV
jgi:probable rRNA maturation factor